MFLGKSGECPPHTLCLADSAEHVIEIRSKRTSRDIGSDCNTCDTTGCTLMWCELPKQQECKPGEEYDMAEMQETWGNKPVKRTHYFCERVTNSLSSGNSAQRSSVNRL